jgi:hypothetical protein
MCKCHTKHNFNITKNVTQMKITQKKTQEYKFFKIRVTNEYFF